MKAQQMLALSCSVLSCILVRVQLVGIFLSPTRHTISNLLAPHDISSDEVAKHSSCPILIMILRGLKPGSSHVSRFRSNHKPSSTSSITFIQNHEILSFFFAQFTSSIVNHSGFTGYCGSFLPQFTSSATCLSTRFFSGFPSPCCLATPMPHPVFPRGHHRLLSDVTIPLLAVKMKIDAEKSAKPLRTWRT